MRKTILLLSIFSASVISLHAARPLAATAFPVAGFSWETSTMMEESTCLLRGEAEGEPTISIEKKVLRVQNATGMTLTIFSITGQQMETFAIDAPDKRIPLHLKPGVYLFRVGNVTRKLYV